MSGARSVVQRRNNRVDVKVGIHFSDLLCESNPQSDFDPLKVFIIAEHSQIAHDICTIDKEKSKT